MYKLSIYVISIHSLSWETTCFIIWRLHLSRCFNRRFHEGSDISNTSVMQNFSYFNSRSREGSDWSSRSLVGKRFDFNPRSREGSDRLAAVSFTESAHFNPRSREGSDFRDFLTVQHTLISIHAPAKGATILFD